MQKKLKWSCLREWLYSIQWVLQKKTPLAYYCIWIIISSKEVELYTPSSVNGTNLHFSSSTSLFTACPAFIQWSSSVCSILEHLSDPSHLLHLPSSRLNSDPYQLCLDPKEIVLKANNIDDFTHLLKSSTGPVFMESNPHFFLEYPKSVWTWTGCLSSSPPSGTLPSTPHTLMPLCFFTYVLAASNALHSQHFYNPEVIPHPTLSAWLLLFLQDSDPMSSCKSSLVSLNGVETPFSMLPYSIT